MSRTFVTRQSRIRNSVTAHAVANATNKQARLLHLFFFYDPSSQTACLSSEIVLNFWATVCKTVRQLRPMLLDRCLSVCPVLSCPVCNVSILWPNGWTDQDETWQADRPRPWSHCVRWGPMSPPPNGHSLPYNFRPIYVVAKWLDGSRCHVVGR